MPPFLACKPCENWGNRAAGNRLSISLVRPAGRTRGGDVRNPKLIARVGGQGVFRHRLPGNLPRQGLIDTTLDVDFGKLDKLKLSIGAQLLAFARQIRLFGVGLRDDSSGIPPVGSDPSKQHKYDDDDQDGAQDTDATVTVAVAITAEAATEAAKQENDEDDNENGSERHATISFRWIRETFDYLYAMKRPHSLT